VLANSVLHLWRLPAFYGDETLNVGGLFEESEAKLALSYAASAQFCVQRRSLQRLPASRDRADAGIIFRRVLLASSLAMTKSLGCPQHQAGPLEVESAPRVLSLRDPGCLRGYRGLRGCSEARVASLLKLSAE
jgi:hypothetical protein